MGKRTLDTVLSIGGDILAPFTGGASAVIGNGVAGADEIAHGDILGGVLNLLGAGGVNPLAQVGQQVGEVAGSELANVAGLPGQVLNTASQVGGAVGTAAADSATKFGAPAILDPILQRTLGISQGGAPPTTPTQNMSPRTTGGGGGAGPSSGPGGLNISGGTAPQIYPYTKQSGGSPGGSAGAQQPQARGI